MKLFFVLGRNPELSRLEILSYYEARSVQASQVLFESNLLVLDLDLDKEPSIQEFGGVIRLGRIAFEGSHDSFEEFLVSQDLIPSDKFSFAVFGNVDPQPLKDKFKHERRKAVLKHGRRLIKMQGGGTLQLPKADYSLFLHQLGNNILYGLVSQEYDVTEIERRDMGKPVRRAHLAISPRLAKVLINLSGATPNISLLDPFCGVGGILQEALLKGISVKGSDKDKKAVVDAEKNLAWLANQYKIIASYQLSAKDASRLSHKNIGAIATETPLGVVLKKKPTDKQAKKIIRDFESLIIPLLKNLKRVKASSARIAITFPAIRSFHVDHEKIAENTGLAIVHGPLLESRKDQFIGRDIIIFS